MTAKKTNVPTLPKVKPTQIQEAQDMSPTSDTAKDIKQTGPVKGSFAEQMQQLQAQAEIETQELIDEREAKNSDGDGSKTKSVHPEDLKITRPPSWGKMVAECLNYG